MSTITQCTVGRFVSLNMFTVVAHNCVSETGQNEEWLEQGVAVTGRNSTVPPWRVTDDRRRQTPESITSLPAYTMRCYRHLGLM